MRNMITIVCALAILVGAGTAFGVKPPEHFYFNDTTGTGGDNLWLNPNNWTDELGGNGVPQDYEDDNAWIGGGQTAVLQDGPASGPQNATPKRLRCGMLDGTTGTLLMTSGQLNLNLGYARYGYIANSGAGVGDGHVIQEGGDFRASGFGLASYGATGTWDISGGNILLNGSSGINIATGRDKSNSTGIMTQSGSGVVHITCSGEPAANLDIVSSDWVGNMHDQTGSYTISGGILCVHGDRVENGAIALGPANDNCSGNRATFHVIGTWDWSNNYGTVVDNIQANGFRMENAGTDNLATLIYDIVDNGIEKIVVVNDAQFAGKIVVTTDVPLTEDHYVLMTYNSRNGTTFDASALPAGTSLAYDQGVCGSELWLVPEPATLTLLGLGGLGVLIRRKRR